MKIHKYSNTIWPNFNWISQMGCDNCMRWRIRRRSILQIMDKILQTRWHDIKAVSYIRWLQIKRVIKFCDKLVKKRDLINFWLLLTTSLHSQNEPILIGLLMWLHGGCSDIWTGVSVLVMGKPNVTKRGQTILFSDSPRNRPMVCVH